MLVVDTYASCAAFAYNALTSSRSFWEFAISTSIGKQLGSYKILSLLGAGGMGEVYRARDPKLERDVAIKVLPETFASDPDRLARFQREAQVAASLNHPDLGGSP